jgi:hypothetical protein
MSPSLDAHAEIRLIITLTGAGKTISVGKKALDVTKTRVKIKITKMIIGAMYWRKNCIAQELTVV